MQYLIIQLDEAAQEEIQGHLGSDFWRNLAPVMGREELWCGLIQSSRLCLLFSAQRFFLQMSKLERWIYRLEVLCS